MNDDTKKFIGSLKSKWVGAKGLSQLIHDINERFITKVDATTALNTKVTKVPGKDLSDENYTAFEKNKLDGVESGAQINVLEKVKVNGKLQANADKTVDIFVPTDDNQIANSADYQNGKQVAASIKVETDARTAADNSLLAEISNEANTRSEADSVLTDGLNSEITSRTNADKTLQDNLDKEASARTTADSTLQSNIDKEASARAAADSTEATTRANADKTLQDNLDKETSARTAADSTLQSNLDKETSARTSADSTEATARANADKTLQSNIDKEASARTAADNSLQSNINLKVDIAPTDITGKTVDILSLVKDMGSKGIGYSKWICKTDGGSSNISNKFSAHSFSCEAILDRWAGSTDYVCVLLYYDSWYRKLQYAFIKQNTTSITYSACAIDSDLTSHKSNKSNPHGVTASQVGLGNVANINQSKAIKSITRNGLTFTATCLDGKTFTFSQQDTTYPDATSSAHGLMSKDDKVKLDGIAAGANKYTHPSYTAKSSGLYKVTVDGTGHVSAATAVTKADITALGIPGQDTNTTYSDATTSAHGLMTAADKSKLNGIASGATKNVSTVKSFTLSASSWSSGTYTISDSLITASSNQEVLPATTITAAQYNALSKAQIIDGGQSAGKLTLKALGTTPTVDIPIRVIFRGTI